MSANTIEVEALRVGMYIHLDLGWWAHPFALSSFLITSADQIATIRGLGLKRLRWSPERSKMASEAEEAAEAGAPAQEDAAATVAEPAPAVTAPSAHKRDLAAQRAAEQLCERQADEAQRAWKQAAELVFAKPRDARATAEGLTQALLDKMMVDGEMCIRVLSESVGERSGAHALNVAVLSMLMGRVFGLAESEMMDLGVGALMHDIGKLDLPERTRHPDMLMSQAETALYREHVAKGLQHAQKMGLQPGAMQVIAQHHELADGSGFPAKLGLDRMALGARVVALINRYDNLCNPSAPSHALTPHEALSLIFAQSKSKFDATMLNAFIRMMGVYPPGSVVQLTDDRYAIVLHVNSSRPLKPRVLVYDPSVPPAEALLLNLEGITDLGIRRSLKPAQLPAAAHEYLAPRKRVAYFFEPAPLVQQREPEDVAA